jgi:hypothetical protein
MYLNKGEKRVPGTAVANLFNQNTRTILSSGSAVLICEKKTIWNCTKTNLFTIFAKLF